MTTLTRAFAHYSKNDFASLPAERVYVPGYGVMATDASGDGEDRNDKSRGWGFLVYASRDVVFHSNSHQFDELQHIFVYEMRAVIRLLEWVNPSPQGQWQRLLVGIDNLPLVRALVREYTSSRAGRLYLLHLLQICRDKRVEIHPHWIHTKRNAADSLSRGHGLPELDILRACYDDIMASFIRGGSHVAYSSAPFVPDPCGGDDDLEYSLN